MDLTKAIELFEELKQRIDQHGKYLRESEYRTRILLIDPLLRILGWDVEDFHCVEIEFRTSQSVQERADYVLKNGESKVAIVEAKRLGTVMSAVERRQAKEYADYADTSQCVLTDGAKWLLYDLNQGRNPDTMQPWVEFDIENNSSELLVLRCLALWRPNFTSKTNFLPISNPSFGSSVDNDRLETNTPTNEPQEESLSDDLPINDDKRYPFASSGRLYPQGTKPTLLKIGNRVDKPVEYWVDVIHEVVTWLIDEGKLSNQHCPIEIGKKTFINSEAVNRDGTPFKNQQQLPKNLFLQRSIETDRQWPKLKELLIQFNVDRRKIEVSY